MSIATAIQAAQQKVVNAYTAVNTKGGTLPATQNLSNLPTAIDSIPSGGGGGGGTDGSFRTVVNGVFKIPEAGDNFEFKLPSNATDIGDNAMGASSGVFYSNLGVISADFSSLTTVSGNNALGNAFSGCTNLTSVDLSNLTTVSGNSALSGAFGGCTNLTSVDLSNLTTVSGNSALSGAFGGCTNLTSVDLSSLTTVSGSSAFRNTFGNCTNLTNINLSNLTTLSGGNAFNQVFSSTGITNISFSSLSDISGSYALRYCFRFSSSIITASFPALTSTSFGSYTNQFNGMLTSVSDCTVHFPSNLQSVIGSWSDVTAGFGGTNTTVLFDLPATT